MQHSTIVRPVAAFLAALLAAGSAALAPNASLRKDPASENKAGISYTDGSLVLAENGKLDCKITAVKEDAGEAAQIFLDMAGKVLGTEVSENENAEIEIVLDFGEVADRFDERVDGIEYDGFVIAEKNGKLYIYGDNERSLVYGVYAFFEEYCGCRYLTSKADYIPVSDTITIEKDEFNLQNPYFHDREVEYRDLYGNTEFQYKQRLNADVCGAKRGSFCHTYASIIPPSMYEEHPDWFAEYNGKRFGSDEYGAPNQLCYTNEEMSDYYIKVLGEQIAAHPEKSWWAVAVNDGPSYYCQCEKCAALDEAAGSHIGALVHFINKVARAFPDKTITTMAYYLTRTAPVTHIEVEPNVLFNIVADENFSGLNLKTVDPEKETDFIAQGDPGYDAVTLLSDLPKFREYNEEMYVWFHIVNFGNYLSPYPNLRNMQPNFQYLYEQGVRYLFVQGSREVGGDLYALREYLAAKLAWNPYCDIEAIADDFLNCYYGDAAPMMKEYIDLLHDKYDEAYETNGEVLTMYDTPSEKSWTKPNACREYLEILDRALEAVKDDAELTRRVNEQKLCVTFALVFQLGRKDMQEYLDFIEKTSEESGITTFAESFGMDIKGFIEKARMKNN